MPEAGGIGLRRLVSVRAWPVWDLPGALLGSVLVVEATALGLVAVAAAAAGPPEGESWSVCALLTLLGVLHTEIAVRTERTRRRTIIDIPHVGLTSVWTFAGAIALPPALAALVAVAVQTHCWARTGRPRISVYRTVFSTATVVLACLAASLVRGLAASVPSWPPLVFLLLALLVYTTVNSALVGGAVAMSSAQPTLASLVGRWDDNLLEVATLSLGALVGTALPIEPWLVLLVLPPLIVLHRAVLVRHLQEAASMDPKTGLLNAATWHTRAAAALGRAAGAPRAVLVLDLDHFKTVNDTHGHLVGDRVLAEVAGAVRAELRDGDLVGRFGGEEFVVLLDGLEGGTEADLETVAERIRRRVAALQIEIPTADGPLTINGMSVSIGGAVHAGSGADLATLLHVADTALYAAKHAGRNRVRMGSAADAALAAAGAGTDSAAEPPDGTGADRAVGTRSAPGPTESDRPIAQDHPDVGPSSS